MRTTLRTTRRTVLAVALATTFLPAAPPAAARPSSTPTPPPPSTARAQAALDALPLRFEANQGQFDPAVRFVAKGGGYTLFLAADEAVLTLARPALPTDKGAQSDNSAKPGAAGHDVVRMALSGANPNAVVVPTERLSGTTNYFIGNDPSAWHNDVASYAGVRYKAVYPGIDMVFRQGPGAVEYDFEVAPGADPAAIAMTFDGGGRPGVNGAGDLVLSPGSSGQLRQSKPTLFQEVDGKRRPVTGAFTVADDGKVGFEVADYDRSKPLVIDPVLTYSSYLSGLVGGESVATGVAAGASGAAYVTGYTAATDFPVKGAVQATNAGRTDHFVAKFLTGGSGAGSLAYSTYLGGNLLEDGGDIAVDGAGNAYVTGTTTSTNFPVTAGAFDPGCGTNSPATCNGIANLFTDGQSTSGSVEYASASAVPGASDVGLAISGANIAPGTTIAGTMGGTGGTPVRIVLSQPATGTGSNLSFTIADRNRFSDAFVTKLNPAGSALLYSTYLGGAGGDAANAIALGATGVAYVTGSTSSSGFPVTAATAYDTLCGSDGSCDAQGYTEVDGASTAGSTTYTVSFPGDFNRSDIGKAITGTYIDPGTTITGVVNFYTITLSAPATTTGTGLSYTIAGKYPLKDAFVAKIDTGASGSASLAYSTFLGGNDGDEAKGMAVDSAGRVYLAGEAQSIDFPTVGAYQGPGSGAGFVAKLDPGVPGPSGLAYSTYLTGEPLALAIDGADNAYVTGTTLPGLPTKAPTGFSPYDTTYNGNRDAFAVKVNTGATGEASLVYSTYLGGSDSDVTHGIAVDNASPPNVTLVGETLSPDFPQVRPFQLRGSSFVTDAFVAQLNGTGSGLVYSSYLGGSGNDIARAVALDGANNPYVAGLTTSSNFPISSGGYQQSFNGSGSNAFLTRLDPANDAAILTSASPRGGPDTGGTSVVITGQNLTGVTAVNFGAATVTTTPCPATPTSAGCFTADSLTQVTAVSPACPGCTGANITVTAATGPSSSVQFTYGEGLFSPTAACTAVACNSGSHTGVKLVQLRNGKILAVNGPDNPAQLYDPATGTWSATGTCPSTCAYDPSLTVLKSGKVLMAGGIPANSNGVSAAAFLYDPATGTWSAAGSMTTPRSFHTATLLNNGKVLVAGGCTGGICETPYPGVKSAELFDPDQNGGAGQWAATGSMSTARWGHTATLLNGPACTGASPPAYCGRVVVAGGYEGAVYLGTTATAERFDPAGNGGAGSWATAGTMSRTRMHHTATLLTGGACNGATPPSYCGKVLMAASGSFAGESSTAELYDPAANGGARWVNTGSMATARYRYPAVLLPNGAVLAAGFRNVNADVGELYQPALGTWSSAGGVSWSTANNGAVAQLVLLGAGPASACGANCGKVLAIGDGIGGNKAGLYTPRPAVTSITPVADCTVGGAAVTITGTGLASVTKVNFGAVASTRLIHDPATPDTRLVVAVPPGTAGTISIKAFSPGGESVITTTADDLAYSATLAGGVPCAPQNVNGSASTTTATVTWTAPTAGSDPTGYTVTAIPPSTTYLDGVSTNNSTTYTSASAGFTAADVGKAIRGPNIAAGATIASVTNATTIVLSAVATGSGTNLDFTLPDRNYAAPVSVNVGAGVFSHTFSGLTDSGTTASKAGYRFTVTATNASGAGPAATTATVLPRFAVVTDFDGDLDTDISVFRPSAGSWFSNNGFAAQYGANGDIPVPGDYDGDAKADTAVFRPATGTWFIHNSATNTDTLLSYGVGTDIPVPGDYTGDGRSEVAIYRPSSPTNLAGGTWYIRDLTNDTDTIVTFGTSEGDIPVVGDYDGDGRADRGIFRPSSGGWFIQQSSGGETSRTYGAAGDIPVPGDYDGDAKTDVGVFRPSVGTWFVNFSGTGTDSLLTYGVQSDQVQPGDYNGDGRTDIAIYRPTTPTNAAGGTWYIRNLSNGTDTIVTFGPLQGDMPLPLPNAIRRFFY